MLGLGVPCSAQVWLAGGHATAHQRAVHDALMQQGFSKHHGESGQEAVDTATTLFALASGAVQLVAAGASAAAFALDPGQIGPVLPLLLTMVGLVFWRRLLDDPTLVPIPVLPPDQPPR
jgi:hypothetical protein